jgi:hypothetical protein
LLLLMSWLIITLPLIMPSSHLPHLDVLAPLVVPMPLIALIDCHVASHLATLSLTWLIGASPFVTATITHPNRAANPPSIVLFLLMLIAIVPQTSNPIASMSCHHSHCCHQQSWQLQCSTSQLHCRLTPVAPPLPVRMQLLLLLLLVQLLLYLLLPLGAL